MADPTSINPEHVTATSGQLNLVHGPVAATPGTLQGTCMPMPAAGDPISWCASMSMWDIASGFSTQISDSVTKFLHGTTMVVQVAADYAQTDVDSGEVVRGNGGHFIR